MSQRLHWRNGWPSAVRCFFHLCQPSRHVHGLLMARRYAQDENLCFRWAVRRGRPFRYGVSAGRDGSVARPILLGFRTLRVLLG